MDGMDGDELGPRPALVVCCVLPTIRAGVVAPGTAVWYDDGIADGTADGEEREDATAVLPF